MLKCAIFGTVVKKDIIYVKQRRKKKHIWPYQHTLVYHKPTFYFLYFSYVSPVPDVFL